MLKSMTSPPYYTKPTSGTLDGRWCSFGPYYAMFPIDFSLNTIYSYTNVNDWVLDPFCGRGTVLYTAEMLGRHAVGFEISKLGWLYSSVKLSPAKKNTVVKRAKELFELSITKYQHSYKEYDEFFNTCYSPQVLNFLIAAREELSWKTNKRDRTLMAFIAVSAHGEDGQTFSNQMQHVKACGPNYAIKWWKEKGFKAPNINPLDLIIKKIEWRYAKGFNNFYESKIILGDSGKKISRRYLKDKKFKMLFTSPPYYKVTDYHLDQWIRLWLLGETNEQKFNPDPNKNNFGNQEHYINLLTEIFTKSKKFLTEDATVYIRTDARDFSKKTTIEILKNVFKDKEMTIIERPFLKRTQTALHGDIRQKPGECDIILTPLKN
ncbi:MAG: DNA modification methylase [Sulfurimonas sp.]|nr:MAG: DNA modification methylase [Sulfurimonas sp.]